MKRSSGLLLHPTSLPGPYGIGTLGKGAFDFVDFLEKAGQKLWQILPLGPTGYGDSPYQCFSAYAGNPFLIDPGILRDFGWLSDADLAPSADFPTLRVDYGRVSAFNRQILQLAFGQFKAKANSHDQNNFHRFCDENKGWLDDFGLFMALKEENQLRPWYEWDKALVRKDPESLSQARDRNQSFIEFQKFVQFLFFTQWQSLKAYANAKGIKIVGDIPIYVSPDSVEAWLNTDIFQYDLDNRPSFVAGVPPDYFSATGQLWGNPVYNWDRLKETGFQWWIDRLRMNLSLYDVIRIDHFRGFAGYWAVPYGETTAINGQWLPAPGMELFETLFHHFGELPVIAEDLGVITPDVVALRDHFDLPGMKILQFAFDSAEGNNYLPHAYPHNCIVYTGTHDNDTVVGWYKKAGKADREFCKKYLASSGRSIHRDFIRSAWASVADVAIAPMQDLLGLGPEHRMNLPGTTSQNWQWRMEKDVLTNTLALELADLTRTYGR